ncbi:unnamed protein product [Linum trigynum]|uniref:Copia protein n=1 Tax=Linum trigynum TaxID=586398 RepID=A0AAV2FG86_9ROSI
MTALFQQLPIQPAQPYMIYYDSLSTVKMTENSGKHERTKHIEVDWHFTRDQVNAGKLKVQHISTTLQLDGPFTKALPVHTFVELISKLNMKAIHA